MHQKKIAKLKKFSCRNLLHSIPIKDKLNRSNKFSFSKRNNLPKSNKFNKHKLNATISCVKRNTKKLLLHHNFGKLSYSIPLLSSLALLVVGLVATNPFSSISTNKASAVGNVIDVDYQRVMRSTATLTITPATSGGHGATNGVATEIVPGSVGYRAHDVSASVSDSTSYMLNLSYTENEKSLHLVDGLITFEDVDKNGVEGSANIGEDQWGFAWGDKTATDADMTYYQVPQYHTAGTGIKNGVLEFNTTGTDRTATIDKKLVFAANFSPYTISGHYVASVLLSLAATPNDVSRLSELTDLQGMSPQICKNTPVGETNVKPVIDIRDDNLNKGYNVVKLANGDCWMQENLSLELDGKTLTPADSNVKDNWVSDTGEPIFWNNSENQTNLVKYWDGKSTKQTKSTSTATEYTAKYKAEYGYYYSYDAATAGKGSSVTTSGGFVSQDICPKGWRLPTKAEFDATVAGTTNGTWASGSGWTLKDGSGLFFPLTGNINPSGSTPYYNVGSSGYYWSSTTRSSTNAYSLDVYSNTSTGTNARYYGMTVRCIAKKQGDA